MPSGQALSLKTAIGSYGVFQSLKRGDVRPDGVQLDHVDVTPISDAFKPMCRNLEFDVAEMSITGYLLARAYDKGLTALPVFPVRAFQQGYAAIACNASAKVGHPRDLEGKVVGARAYTGAASFWVRGMLAHEFGVDIGRIEWVSVDEEHVLEFQNDAPPNAVYRIGANLNELVSNGELAAVIGLPAKPPELSPMFPNAVEAALDYVRRTRIYQINHTIVVRDALLADHPWLAGALYEAFEDSKRRWLDSRPDLGAAKDIAGISGDPLPYGVEANRSSIEAMVRFALEQRILRRPFSAEALFPSK